MDDVRLHRATLSHRSAGPSWWFSTTQGACRSSISTMTRNFKTRSKHAWGNRDSEAATRLNQAKSILLANESRLLSELHNSYQLQLAAVSSAKPLAAGDLEEMAETLRQHPASHDRSELGKRLRNLLENQRGRPTAAIVMFTDGITTEGKTLSEVAQYCAATRDSHFHRRAGQRPTGSRHRSGRSAG